jgi:hypothetical protein
VRDEWARAASTVELADCFGVSEEAMGWRLYNLQLAREAPQV